MTVRMLLPFSMGKTMYINPNTFEPDIYHPILDIGSSFSSIKPHIMEWLKEHYGNSVNVGFSDGDYYIDFPTETDKTLFILRWL